MKKKKRKQEGLGVDITMATVARQCQGSKNKYMDTDIQHWYFYALHFIVAGYMFDVRILKNYDVRVREGRVKAEIPFVVMVDRDGQRVRKRIAKIVKPLLDARRTGKGPVDTEATLRKRERPR